MTLIAMVVAVFAICNTNMSSNINEGYAQQRIARVQQTTTTPEPDFYLTSRIRSKNNSPIVNHKFDGAEGGGPYQRVKNNKCNKQLYVSQQPDIATYNKNDDNYTTVANNAYKKYSIGTILDSDDETINDNGELLSSVTTNNLMFANLKSRHTGHGCWLRGDLAIPECDVKQGWFKSHIKADSLQTGALMVLGGQCLENTKNLIKERNKVMVTTNASGVDLSSQEQQNTICAPSAVEYGTKLGTNGDVSVTTYL